jgi:hypothetical protein
VTPQDINILYNLDSRRALVVYNPWSWSVIFWRIAGVFS